MTEQCLVEFVLRTIARFRRLDLPKKDFEGRDLHTQTQTEQRLFDSGAPKTPNCATPTTTNISHLTTQLHHYQHDVAYGKGIHYEWYLPRQTTYENT